MPERFLATFLTSIAALSSIPLCADAAEKDIDTGSLRLVQVSEDVYAVSPKFAGANGAVILDESGNIVVDSHGSPASARALIEAVKTLSDKPIRYVINTHWHLDHHSGNRTYRETFGENVVFISHDETRREIPTLGADQFRQAAAYRSMPIQAASGALAENADIHGEPLTASQIAAIEAFRSEQTEFAEEPDFSYLLADLTYSKSVTLHGESNTIEIFFLHPAHTRSDSIVYIRDKETLIVGDLLTKPILWTWSSYPTSYVLTLKALEQLPVKQIIIGHGGPVLEGKSYLEQARRFLEVTVAYATDAHSAGLSIEEAIREASANVAIESSRRRFVSDAEDEMFDQMVGWTIERTYMEL